MIVKKCINGGFMKKTLAIANTIAFLLTVIVNYLSNTGFINGNTMKTVSDKYHNLFTPAGYAFSIWGVIYVGLLGFVIYALISVFKKTNISIEKEIERIGWWFVGTCIFNVGWIFAWLYDYTGLSVPLMCGLFFCLMIIVIRLRMELDYHPFKKYLFVFWPFALYSGWVSVAIIANIPAWLTKIGWNQWGISSVSWTFIMILVAAVIHILMIWLRNLREFALMGVWAFIAIAVANSEGIFIQFAAYSAAALLLLNIGMHALTASRSLKKM